jgi:hypothetical protein
MDEATRTIAPRLGTVIAPAIRASMSRAVGVLARQAAIREVKAAIRREGWVKLSTLPHREIVARAEEMMLTDVPRRAKIIAKAKRIVEQWHAEGVFGPRGGIRTR